MEIPFAIFGYLIGVVVGMLTVCKPHLPPRDKKGRFTK